MENPGKQVFEPETGAWLMYKAILIMAFMAVEDYDTMLYQLVSVCVSEAGGKRVTRWRGWDLCIFRGGLVYVVFLSSLLFGDEILRGFSAGVFS